jgi:hypothetical protein
VPGIEPKTCPKEIESIGTAIFDKTDRQEIQDGGPSGHLEYQANLYPIFSCGTRNKELKCMWPYSNLVSAGVVGEP